MSDDQAARAEPVRAPRLGLSGKLLVFTILFVMIAEVLIYVPSIALYRLMWLNDRLASAYTAALVLDAAPNGMVPDSLAKQILDSIGARAVAMKMGTQRRLLAVGDAPPPIADDFDMRHVYAFDSIVDAFKVMLNSNKNVMRVVGPAPMGGDVYRDHYGRAAAAQRHAALLGRPAADLLVDFRHHGGPGLPRAALSVRAADAAGDRQYDRLPRRPGGSRPHHRAVRAGRRNRHRRARACRHADRARLDAAAEKPAGGPWARGIQDQPRSAQPARLGAAFLGSPGHPARSECAALCAQARACARARHRLLPIDLVLRPPAGAAAGSQAAPARAAGRRGARDARA